jgi:outer membrane protein TolC
MSHRLLLSAIALSLAFGTAGAVTVTQAPMDFAQARALLHERADVMQADRAEIARADAAAEAAKSLSGPRVEAVAEQLWGTKTLDLSVDTGISSSLSRINPALAGYDHIHVHTKTDLDGPRASLNAVLPIYTGGQIKAQQNVLRHKASQSRAERDARENELDADLAARYWGVQLARSIETLRKSKLADQEAEVNRARRFEKQGMIAQVERMSVEVSRDKAKREAVASHTDTSVAEARLMKILREDSLPALSTPLFVLTGDLGTLSDWQDKAKSASPLLARMDALRAQADEGVRSAEANYKPKVYAFGNKALIKHCQTIVEPDWMAGIGVTFTLWDNRDRSDTLHTAHEAVNKADAYRRETVNSLETSVEVAFLRVTQAREEFDLTAGNVALARENLRLREKSFHEGLSTALDLDEARTQLIGAEIARRQAAYKFVVGWAQLHAAAGAMPEFLDTLSRSDFMPVR